MKKAVKINPVISLILYTLLYLAMGFLIIRYHWSAHWLMLPAVFSILAAQFFPLWTALAMEAIFMVASLIVLLFLPTDLKPNIHIVEFLALALVLTTTILLLYDLNIQKELTDQELMNNLQRVQYAFEGTQDGVWDWKPAVPELYLSPGLQELLIGETISSLDYHNLTGIIHPEDIESVTQKFTEHYTHQSPHIKVETRVRDRAGNWLWVLLKGKVTEWDANDQPVRIVGTAVDIAEQKKIEQALKESGMIFRQISDNIREVYWLRDRKTRQLIYMKLDDSIKNMESTNDEVRFSTPDYYYKNIHPDDRETIRKYENELYETGKPFLQDYRFFHRDGTIHWLMCRQYPVLDEHGDFYRVIGVVEDITKRKHAELALLKSEKRFRNMVEHQGEGIVIVDTEETFIYTNPAVGHIFGVFHESLLGHRWHEFLDPKQLDILLTQTENRRQGKENSYELVINLPDGFKRNILCTVTPRMDESNQYAGAIEVIRDITERHKEVEQLRYQSTHDALTGLNNRAFFEEELNRLESGDQYPIAIIMMDMDGLKKINDNLGHAAGDTQLVRTAQLLKSSFREGDIVARIGGDEFAILMPRTNRETQDRIIRRLRENIIQENLSVSWSDHPIEISIGGEVCKNRGSLRETLDQADARMYADKSLSKTNTA